MSMKPMEDEATQIGLIVQEVILKSLSLTSLLFGLIIQLAF